MSRDDDHPKIEKLVHEMSVVVRVQKTHENDYRGRGKEHRKRTFNPTSTTKASKLALDQVRQLETQSTACQPIRMKRQDVRQRVSQSSSPKFEIMTKEDNFSERTRSRSWLETGGQINPTMDRCCDRWGDRQDQITHTFPLWLSLDRHSSN